ncbi:hypothetical protein C8F04DRAFT_1238167 [Mycena alexandri]|uniref:Uncharacterized protein n=1 Tax=Mycena alexandri TaxID=1745969 RepID=A0AAD6SHV8_9AGAR|nr:hypothetical protein C8F04DRAFT_1238167 [Mycena alexandri]
MNTAGLIVLLNVNPIQSGRSKFSLYRTQPTQLIVRFSAPLVRETQDSALANSIISHFTWQPSRSIISKIQTNCPGGSPPPGGCGATKRPYACGGSYRYPRRLRARQLRGKTGVRACSAEHASRITERPGNRLTVPQETGSMRAAQDSVKHGREGGYGERRRLCSKIPPHLHILRGAAAGRRQRGLYYERLQCVRLLYLGQRVLEQLRAHFPGIWRSFWCLLKLQARVRALPRRRKRQQSARVPQDHGKL